MGHWPLGVEMFRPADTCSPRIKVGCGEVSPLCFCHLKKCRGVLDAPWARLCITAAGLTIEKIFILMMHKNRLLFSCFLTLSGNVNINEDYNESDDDHCFYVSIITFIIRIEINSKVPLMMIDQPSWHIFTYGNYLGPCFYIYCFVCYFQVLFLVLTDFSLAFVELAVIVLFTILRLVFLTSYAHINWFSHPFCELSCVYGYLFDL